MRAGSASSKFFLGFLLSLPALALLLIIRIYSMNLVCTDDWFVAVSLVGSAMKGALSWPSLFAPYYDHRILIPRLATLAMWKMGCGLRDLPAMEVNWALMCGVAVLTLAGFHAPAPQKPARPRLWCGIPVMIWLFSPYLFATFQTGSYTMFQWTFMLFFAAAALVFLDKASGLDARFWLAAASGCLAAFSNAAGLMVWPSGLAAKIVSDFRPGGRKAKLASLVWLLVGMAAWGAYFYHWHSSALAFSGGIRGEMAYALFHPGRVAANAAAYWGVPFASGALRWGVVVLAASIMTLLGARRSGALWNHSLWAFFWLFTFFISVERAAGRAWIGSDELQSGSNFYLTALPGLIGLYYLALDVFYARRMAIAAGFGLLSFLPLRLTLIEWKSNRFLHQTMSHALRTYRDQSDLGLARAWVYCPMGSGTPRAVRDLAPVLENNHFNVFGDPPAADPLPGRLIEDASPCGGIDEINEKPFPAAREPVVISPGEGVEAMGWALDPREKRPASAVYVSVDDHWDILASYGQRRRDVASRLHRPAAVYIGWLASFRPERLRLKPGPHFLSLKAVSAGGVGYYRSPRLVSFFLNK